MKLCGVPLIFTFVMVTMNVVSDAGATGLKLLVSCLSGTQTMLFSGKQE